MNDYQREMKEIGRHLVFVRLAKRLTQEQVAELANIDLELVKILEAGTIKKRDNMAVLKIANALHISYDWILSGEIPKEETIPIKEAVEKSLHKSSISPVERVILCSQALLECLKEFDNPCYCQDYIEALETSLESLGIDRIKAIRSKFYNQ